MIGSLYELYPAFSKDILVDVKLKLYLEPFIQMKEFNGRYVRWTNIRLIRRMLCDSVFRAYKPQQTFERWHYVHSSELKDIIPYSNTADFIISSAMPYELPIYANKMLKLFEEWNNKYKEVVLKQDAYECASRVYNLLKTVTLSIAAKIANANLILSPALILNGPAEVTFETSPGPTVVFPILIEIVCYFSESSKPLYILKSPSPPSFLIS